MPQQKHNLDFLALFLKVLIQGSSTLQLDPSTERDLYNQIGNLYAVDPGLRTLSVLTNALGHQLTDRPAKRIRGGQFVFDNSEDSISFSLSQCFDFQGMSQ